MIYLVDSEEPHFLSTPNDITQYAEPGEATAVVDWTPPTATDNSGSVTMTSTHEPGTALNVGSTTVTYTATDPSGNSVEYSFTINVEGKRSYFIIRKKAYLFKFLWQIAVSEA